MKFGIGDKLSSLLKYQNYEGNKLYTVGLPLSPRKSCWGPPCTSRMPPTHVDTHS